jgi:hypothetical protein
MPDNKHVFLLIDDEKGEQESFFDTIRVLNSKPVNQNSQTFAGEIAGNFEDGQSKINSMSGQLDGVIIDLNLNGPLDGKGNDLATEICKTHRVPFAIYTATPAAVSSEITKKGIRCFTKGADKSTLKDIIGYLENLSSTGIFETFCGTGIINDYLSKIYWDNLFPKLETWSLETDKKKTREKLVLYTIILLNEYANTLPQYDPDEFYVSPQIGRDLFQNGSIYKNTTTGEFEIIITPPCDLFVRSVSSGHEETNSNQITVCRIENEKDIPHRTLGDAKANKKLCFHYLPKSVFFDGGFVDFREVMTYEKNEFSKNHDTTSSLKVASTFMKNILSRFAIYYSRQGQPDIIQE